MLHEIVTASLGAEELFEYLLVESVAACS